MIKSFPCFGCVHFSIEVVVRYHQLLLEISRGIVAGLSIRTIASQLGRARSTVSREVIRNGGRERYRASQADEAAWQRAHHPKPCKLA
jgi:IS30 family transposase